jgi:hypothetical protein
MYRAYITRASSGDLDNSPIIEQVRLLYSMLRYQSIMQPPIALAQAAAAALILVTWTTAQSWRR